VCRHEYPDTCCQRDRTERAKPNAGKFERYRRAFYRTRRVFRAIYKRRLFIAPRRDAPRCRHGLTAAARPAHPPVRRAACNRGNSPLPATATTGDARTMRYATSRRAGVTAEIPGQTLRPVIEP